MDRSRGCSRPLVLTAVELACALKHRRRRDGTANMESKTSLPPGLTRGLSSSSVSLTVSAGLLLCLRPLSNNVSAPVYCESANEDWQVDIHGQDETLSETIEEQ